jgi:hypothetical protein
MEGITYYCTKLTGITSSHVEHAPTLSETLRMVCSLVDSSTFLTCFLCVCSMSVVWSCLTEVELLLV